MGKSRFHRLCVPLLRLTASFRRCRLSKRTLLVAAVCALYWGVVVLHVGHSERHRDRKTGGDKYRHTRGLYHLESGGDHPQTAAGFVVPTRSNVVYITLKAKRLKPANIRGTIRPKLRRKARRNKSAHSAFTQNKVDTLGQDAGQIQRNVEAKTSWRESRDVDYKSLDVNQDAETESHGSSIRIYSQRAPPWLSQQDVKAMRFLADAKVLRIREVSRGGDSPSLLIFEAHRGNGTAGYSGTISSPVDTTEVFAFHLDRVLGLNRTLPAVSRRFRFIHDAQPCPVVSWDASLYPEGLAAGRATVKLTWGDYQHSLKQRCWLKNISPKPESGCSTIHHYEWSKLALFDFLLQIHNRLDQSCCGFRPRQEDVCVKLGHHAQCADKDHIKLANIIHRDYDSRHLVFTHNKGFFDRNEDNLDFRLLEGIKELPEQVVSVLRSRRLREKLLQSLFLDQTYWESQGGRQGIDKLIDVIEKRVKVLLTYINAHGIKVIAMNV
ncbi:Golgi-associated kinase 1B [Echeneis naucrates]|uniref:Golgi associated kinase 1B n=1 Tax=Echeneis naucrates TaxID=173247 RepID=A0A665VJH2_ECHNA|nr:Golgi-associated kinase 1B [Echeneis naucrates]